MEDENRYFEIILHSKDREYSNIIYGGINIISEDEDKNTFIKIVHKRKFSIFKYEFDCNLGQKYISMNNIILDFFGLKNGDKIDESSIFMDYNIEEFETVGYFRICVQNMDLNQQNIDFKLISDNIKKHTFIGCHPLFFKKAGYLYKITPNLNNCFYINKQTKIELNTQEWTSLGDQQNLMFEYYKNGGNPNKPVDQKILNKCINNNVNNVNKRTLNISEIKSNIGGLNQQINTIIRRVLLTRIMDYNTIKKLGLSHVKGLLLYGPTGTGKTLIARNISKIINADSFTVVKGPELFGKYVGESERNVRALFENAIRTKDDPNSLHIITIDEADSLFETRNNTCGNSNARNSVVNQFLTMIDGIESLNNILLILTTNRKDMIDPAILRPGRIEVHIEILLPDTNGRLDIFKIHTSTLSKNNCLANDVDLNKLSNLTENYSGADIEGLIKSALSYAIKRETTINDNIEIGENIVVENNDFESALLECKKNNIKDELDIILSKEFIIWGMSIQLLVEKCVNRISSLRIGNKIALLLHGKKNCGKTIIACNIARICNYNKIIFISPSQITNFNNEEKISYINSMFTQAYTYPSSIIILDNFTELIKYSSLHHIYNNDILQCLLNNINSTCKNTNRCVIIFTLTDKKDDIIEILDIKDYFNLILNIETTLNTNEISLFNRLNSNLTTKLLSNLDNYELQITNNTINMIDVFKDIKFRN